VCRLATEDSPGGMDKGPPCKPQIMEVSPRCGIAGDHTLTILSNNRDSQQVYADRVPQDVQGLWYIKRGKCNA
jgi:hypothetical protein